MLETCLIQCLIPVFKPSSLDSPKTPTTACLSSPSQATPMLPHAPPQDGPSFPHSLGHPCPFPGQAGWCHSHSHHPHPSTAPALLEVTQELTPNWSQPQAARPERPHTEGHVMSPPPQSEPHANTHTWPYLIEPHTHYSPLPGLSCPLPSWTKPMLLNTQHAKTDHFLSVQNLLAAMHHVLIFRAMAEENK